MAKDMTMRVQGQHPASVPREFLIGAAFIVVVAMGAALMTRLTGGPQDKPQSSPVMTRILRFEDRPNGSIAVYDAKPSSAGDRATTSAADKPIDVIAPESNGFIRGSLRALAHKRQHAGIESVDFKLTAWADGRLTLDDPASGGLVELAAFGHTNEEAFARLLTIGRATK